MDHQINPKPRNQEHLIQSFIHTLAVHTIGISTSLKMLLTLNVIIKQLQYNSTTIYNQVKWCWSQSLTHVHTYCVHIHTVHTSLSMVHWWDEAIMKPCQCQFATQWLTVTSWLSCCYAHHLPKGQQIKLFYSISAWWTKLYPRSLWVSPKQLLSFEYYKLSRTPITHTAHLVLKMHTVKHMWIVFGVKIPTAWLTHFRDCVQPTEASNKIRTPDSIYITHLSYKI